jgi:hypothetical protein
MNHLGDNYNYLRSDQLIYSILTHYNPSYTEQHTYRINTHKHPCFEWDSNHDPVLKRAKTVHALDSAVNVFGVARNITDENYKT